MWMKSLCDEIKLRLEMSWTDLISSDQREDFIRVKRGFHRDYTISLISYSICRISAMNCAKIKYYIKRSNKHYFSRLWSHSKNAYCFYQYRKGEK